MLYEKLLIEANNKRVNVYERDIGKLKGLYIDGNIALNTSIRTHSEKACILAEELGHHCTTYGHILDQNRAENRKQERRARAWAYERLVSMQSLIDASKHGIRSRYELAEYLGVSERFLEEAIQYYKDKHGLYYEVGKYIVYFDPMRVLEKYQEGGT